MLFALSDQDRMSRIIGVCYELILLFYCEDEEGDYVLEELSSYCGDLFRYIFFEMVEFSS